MCQKQPGPYTAQSPISTAAIFNWDIKRQMSLAVSVDGV